MAVLILKGSGGVGAQFLNFNVLAADHASQAPRRLDFFLTDPRIAAILNPSGGLPSPRMPTVDTHFFSIITGCDLFNDCSIAVVFTLSWFIFKQLCEFFSSSVSS